MPANSSQQAIAFEDDTEQKEILHQVPYMRERSRYTRSSKIHISFKMSRNKG